MNVDNINVPITIDENLQAATSTILSSNSNAWDDNCIEIIVNNLCRETTVAALPGDVIFSTTDISQINDEESDSPSEEPQNSFVSFKKYFKGKTKKEICKKARNCGRMYLQLYGKNKGSLVEGKSIGPDCGCPSKCFDKVGKETVNKIFRDFWALGDYNAQNAYLFGFISMSGVKRRYTKNTCSRRNYTVSYAVKRNGQNIKVCKKAFLNIHGLQKNRGRVNNLVLKIRAGESVPPPDQRGHHGNRPNAYLTEDINHVLSYLEQCPVTRKKNKKVLDQSLSNRYKIYVEDYCSQRGLSPVSIDKFRRVAWDEDYRAPPHKEALKCKISTTTSASQTSEEIDQ